MQPTGDRTVSGYRGAFMAAGVEALIFQAINVR